MRPLRVLVIEDSEDDALLLLRELRRGGYDVVHQRVDTAEAMRAALAAQEWEVILSDHAMPRFNALAALHIYQEQGLDLPFIIVSGAIGETQAVEAMRSGAHDYILKGNMTRLTAAIERELHEAAERRARREAEQEVAKAAKEWSETFDAVSDLICVLTSDCRIVRANAALAQMAGAEDPASLQGKAYQDVMFGDRGGPYKCPCREAAPGTDMVFPRLAPGRTFEVTFSPILDEGGAPHAFVQVARDVTEKRQLQAQLLQSQKLAALGEVISGIAHELNNPLAAVVAHAQLLRRHHLPGDTEESAKAMEDSALRASRVVQSLLAFARRQTPQRGPVTINQVVQDTLALQAALLRADNIQLALELAPDLPPVFGDAYQLQQVLLNLLNNAHRAMAHAPLRRLTIATEVNGEYLHLRVQDSGVGISEENLGRIFEPFFTTREVGQGTGLGLSVCHGIIQDHGGAIRVSSQVGVGTEFVVDLPVMRAAVLPEREAPPPTPTPSLPQGTRLLVVEDELLIRLALKRMLEDLGATVQAVPHATAALAALEKADFQAVICDLKMPGMDGKLFYREAVARWPALASRFIFCTGDTLNPDTTAFAGQHHLPLLAKPFLVSEVAATVAAVIP